MINYAKEVLNAEIIAIKSVADSLNDNFIKALDLIDNNGKKNNRVIACGIGKAGLIARKISATLSSTGTESIFLHPADALHGDMGVIKKDDIVLILSNSGESDEISRLLPFLRKHKLKIIAVTSSLRSTLGVQADIVLEIGSLKEACPLGIAPTATTTAMLALGDAIAMALMKRQNFTIADYAKFHPAGSLGKKTFTVAEVMRGADAVAMISKKTSVQDAIKEISTARAGAGIIIDNEGKLLGIFTDGDLRRGLINDVDFLEKPIEDVMNSNPTKVSISTPAVEAVELMREKRIGELPVIDENNKAVGMIDLKGILAEGI